MVSYTPIRNLAKPDGPEEVNIGVLNANNDKLDSGPALIVNDGVTPTNSELWDGAIVKEKNSGITWVAQKNGSGTFDKKYLLYPWSAEVNMPSSPGGGMSSSGSFQNFSFLSNYVMGQNSDASCVPGGGGITVPVRGIYSVNASVGWPTSSAGRRGIRTDILTSYYTLDSPTSSGTMAQQYSVLRQLSANTTVKIWLYQDSGSAIPSSAMVFVSLQIALIAPY